MAFAPNDVRARQLDAAELLVIELDAEKAYPLDFLTFRITGRRLPSSQAATDADLFVGEAVQHDLGLLIEQVSGTLDQAVANLAEPVLTIDEVAQRFNVTSKTIQRWRRKGLPARKFLFPDGKRRVGFFSRSVDRFLTSHREEVERGTNFTQLTESERTQILARARRLAGSCHCCMHDIARRVARRFNRSHLTVLHVVKRHDAEKPEQAIFALAAPALSENEKSRILQIYDNGVGLRAVAKRVCRPAGTVYRVILDERYQRLNNRKVRFFDDPLFHQSDAQAVLAAMLAGGELSSPTSAPLAATTSRMPGAMADRLGPLADLCRVPPMNAARERAMFLRLNYEKFLFVTARRQLDPERAMARDVTHLERLHAAFVETRNQIIAANLRLVVGVARRHARPTTPGAAAATTGVKAGGLAMPDLVSEGSLVLMRAVDAFDPGKGFKFSTYATLALIKGYARSVPEMLYQGRTLGGNRSTRLVGGDALPGLSDDRTTSPQRGVEQRDTVDRLLARLDPDERQVVAAHFGLSESTTDSLALSPKRIKQLHESAMAKLRG
jgi:RNA polymerase primary sigma factor